MTNNQMKYSGVFRYDMVLIPYLYKLSRAGKTHFTRDEIEQYFLGVYNALCDDAQQKTRITGICHEVISQSTSNEDVLKSASLVSYKKALSTASQLNFFVVLQEFIKAEADVFTGQKKEDYDNSFFKLLGIPLNSPETDYLFSWIDEEDDYYIKVKPEQIKRNIEMGDVRGRVIQWFLNPLNPDIRIQNTVTIMGLLGTEPFKTAEIENGKEVLINSYKIINEEINYRESKLKRKSTSKPIAEKKASIQLEFDTFKTLSGEYEYNMQVIQEPEDTQN